VSEEIIPISETGFVYDNYSALELICKKIMDSGITRLGNTAQIALVIMRGKSLGLDLFDSLENIHIINNKTTLAGDLAMALVEQSGHFVDKQHVYEGSGDNRSCTVTVQRKGREKKVWSFSMAEAKKAGLLEKKSSPWLTFPDSMLYYRALGFALRREFPDVLRGMHLSEELDQLDGEKMAQVTEIVDLTPEKAKRKPREKGNTPNGSETTPTSFTETAAEATAEAEKATQALPPEPVKQEQEQPLPGTEAPKANLTPMEELKSLCTFAGISDKTLLHIVVDGLKLSRASAVSEFNEALCAKLVRNFEVIKAQAQRIGNGK
jgi:hypothetical protein